MEKLYQYLWKHRMLGRRLRLSDGEEVEVISPGVMNTDSGPDFRNAVVRISGQRWAGNVEIHVRSSDWYRHGHQSDRAYDSVVLHVVAIHDREVTATDGRLIPTVCVTFPEEFFRIYATLAENIQGVRCCGMLGNVPPLVLVDWRETLAVERLQVKARRILDYVTSVGGDWQQACFIALARALGFGLNSDPFEMLARSLPLKLINKHADNFTQVESLIFGQAGMLDTSINIFDEYYQLLCREYFFLARKYGLRPMRADLWKYARTRPGNFPHRRLAFLAKAAGGGFTMLSDLLDAGGGFETTLNLFTWELDGYWRENFDFAIPSVSPSVTLGKGSRQLLAVNFAAPMLHAYHAAHGDLEKAGRAMDLWEALPPEKNTYIRQWGAYGIPCRDAKESQGLLQLRREYCDRERCLDCRFGHILLRRTVKPVARMTAKASF